MLTTSKAAPSTKAVPSNNVPNMSKAGLVSEGPKLLPRKAMPKALEEKVVVHYYYYDYYYYYYYYYYY